MNLRACAGCGHKFRPTRRDQRHCPGSATCRKRAQRNRQEKAKEQDFERKLAAHAAVVQRATSDYLDESVQAMLVRYLLPGAQVAAPCRCGGQLREYAPGEFACDHCGRAQPQAETRAAA